MDSHQPHDSRSSSNRTLRIEDPSPRLVEAIRAQVQLPKPDADGYWEVRAVRAVSAEIQFTRVTHHRSVGDLTAEQPIVWDDPITPPS